MIAQSLDFFAQGIILLIGILLALFFGGIIFLALYISLRVWLFRRRQRLAQEEYLKRTRRADGKMYPPQGFGACDHCGKFRKVIYFLPTGEKLCPPCYEVWWPTAESIPLTRTRPPAPAPQPAPPR